MTGLASLPEVPFTAPPLGLWSGLAGVSTGVKDGHEPRPASSQHPKGAALPPLCAWQVPAHLPSWVSVTPSPGRRKASLASTVHRAHCHPQGPCIVCPSEVFQAVSGSSSLGWHHPEHCAGIVCELSGWVISPTLQMRAETPRGTQR